MKKLMCVLALIVLMVSAACAETNTPDDMLGFWSWIGYETTTTKNGKTTTTRHTAVQYAVSLKEQGQGLWYSTKDGLANYPITWSSDGTVVTITGENLSITLPFGVDEGDQCLVSPNGKPMKRAKAAKSEATATPAPTATPIPVREKYSVDGKECLIMDRDNIQIYLMGTYKDDGPFDSILADIVVVNGSEHEIDLWYTGIANGWSLRERSLINNIVCHAGAKTRAQLLLEKEMIGIDSAKELETLDITFILRHETGTAYLGDVIFEQRTGVVHLHSGE